MKLTKRQKKWFNQREIKVGEAYMFPRFGFEIYSRPDYLYGEYFDCNPLTRSLDHERFLVKEKVNGFCRGNFQYRPKGADHYLDEIDLAKRDVIEKSILYLLCYIPLIIFNFFAGNKK